MLKDLISKNKFSQDINEAIQLQHEASFYITRDINNPYSSTFRNRVLSIYNQDKYKTDRFFDAFSGKSLPSIEVCETIFSELFRVFDSQNQNSEYNFSSADRKANALEYLDKSESFWKNEYWEALKYQFNSFLVTDLPAEAKRSPEPYVFVLDVSRVVYVDLNKNGSVKEIIFTEKARINDQEKLYHYYYTEEFYSKYEIDGETEIEIFKNSHKLKRCPAEFLFAEKLNKGLFLRKGVLVPNLDDLFWYNLKVVESRKSDLLYLNPTMQRPKISCGYDSKTKGGDHISGKSGKCIGGWLYDNDKPLLENNRRVICPICGPSSHGGGGAGNTIDINLDSMAIQNGKVDPTNQFVRYITPEIEGTIKQHEWIIEGKDHLIKSVCGEEQTQSKEAINEKQVKASYESKEGILKRLAGNISIVRQNIERNILELRYGGSFKSNTFFLGSEFYLKSVDDLLKLRKDSTNPIEKKQIDEQIIEVKYRNNPTKLERERLLYKLLPYSTLTDTEFISQIGQSITDQKLIDLRLQFSDCVTAFETQFGSIIEFYRSMDINLPETNKIQTLKQTLLSYVQNQVPRRAIVEQGAD
jgi:hypothetical protein